MKLLNYITIVFSLLVTYVNAQETLYIYKDGNVIGQHELSQVDSIIFYKAQMPNENWVTGDDWIDTRDNQVYGTVLIGDQVWMTDNMNYNIPLKWDGQMGSLISGSRYYNDDNVSYQDHGRLYYWDVEIINSVCPSGWHVPSDQEWTTLVTSSGGFDIAGGKLKRAGIDFWKSPNNDATNEFGFNAISTGMAMYDFNLMEESGIYITSTEDSYGNIWVYKLDYDNGKVTRYSSMKYGFSIRCIKD